MSTTKKTTKKESKASDSAPKESKNSTEERIGTRGRSFVGTVISDRMAKTVTVEWHRRLYVPKYERYLKRRSRVKAHNPPEIDAKVGDKVKIKETRKLSKTKNFIVTEVMK